MKYEYSTNSGPHSIGSILNADFKRCKNFHIATAFISESRVEHLESLIKQNKNLKEGKVIISLYDFINSKETIQKLKDLRSKYSGKIFIRISKNLKFHWKYYNFIIGNTSIHYVGSANYTNSGLSTNGELVIKFKEPVAKESGLLSAFEVEWENSISIEKLQLKDYPVINRVQKTKIPHSIKLLLENKPIIQNIANENANLILIYLSGTLTQQTVDSLINEDSAWDKYDFFSCVYKSEFNKFKLNTNMLLIWKEKGNYVYHLTKVNHLSGNVSTPDGKYFVAYIPPARSRQINNSAAQVLLSNGIKLTSRKWKSTFKVLGALQTKKIRAALK